MQRWNDGKSFCKFLNFKTLERAFRKGNFCTPKGELLGAKSATFRTQKWHFWKVKVQPYIYTLFSVCLCGSVLVFFFVGFIFLEFPILVREDTKKSVETPCCLHAVDAFCVGYLTTFLPLIM